MLLGTSIAGSYASGYSLLPGGKHFTNEAEPKNDDKTSGKKNRIDLLWMIHINFQLPHTSLKY